MRLNNIDAMLTRRDFLATSTVVLALLSIGAVRASQTAFKGDVVLNRIIKTAKDGNWSSLSIGEVMGKVALNLVATPYVAGTLELSKDHEICSVNLEGLDCVTFFESTLGLARMIKKGKGSPADLLNEIRHMRYRGGHVSDYSSRLHYTSDWLVDNEKKHVVQLLSDLPGAEPFTQPVGVMSARPGSYAQLAAHPDLVKKIKKQEAVINARHNLKYIPMDKLADVEPLLKTGDIVGVCSKLPGIDIVHTGLILRTDDGVAHFMDASSKKSNMKVTVEPGPISQSINWTTNNTGAIFARPLEP